MASSFWSQLRIADVVAQPGEHVEFSVLNLFWTVKRQYHDKRRKKNESDAYSFASLGLHQGNIGLRKKAILTGALIFQLSLLVGKLFASVSFRWSEDSPSTKSLPLGTLGMTCLQLVLTWTYMVELSSASNPFFLKMLGISKALRVSNNCKVRHFDSWSHVI